MIFRDSDFSSANYVEVERHLDSDSDVMIDFTDMTPGAVDWNVADCTEIDLTSDELTPANTYEPADGQARNVAVEAEIAARLEAERAALIDVLSDYHDTSALDMAALKEYGRAHNLPVEDIFFVPDTRSVEVAHAIAGILGLDASNPEVRDLLVAPGSGSSIIDAHVGYVIRDQAEEKEGGTIPTEGKAIHEAAHLRRRGSHIIYDPSGKSGILKERNGLNENGVSGASFEEVVPEAHRADYVREMTGSPNGTFGGRMPEFIPVEIGNVTFDIPTSYAVRSATGEAQVPLSALPAAAFDRLLDMDPSLTGALADVKANGDGREVLQRKLDGIQPGLFRRLEVCDDSEAGLNGFVLAVKYVARNRHS